MKLSRTAPTCALACGALLVLAVGGTATALASEPALYQCGHAAKEVVTYESNGKLKEKSVLTGRYTDKTCSEEAPPGELREGGAPEGAYEFEEWAIGSKELKTGKLGKVKEFKSVGSPPATIEIPHVTTVECAHTSAQGEVTGPKTLGNLEGVYTDCKASSLPCQNGAAGEIKTNLLAGELGYLSKATHKVGVDIEPQAPGPLAEFHCGNPPEPTLQVRLTGSIVGEVTPTDVWSKEIVIDFEQTAGVQRFTQLEGFPEDVLEAAYCKSKEVCEPVESLRMGVEARFTMKGEELYLKA